MQITCDKCGSQSFYWNDDGELVCMLCARKFQDDWVTIEEVALRTGLVGTSLQNRLKRLGEPVVRNRVRRRVIDLIGE